MCSSGVGGCVKVGWVNVCVCRWVGGIRWVDVWGWGTGDVCVYV